MSRPSRGFKVAKDYDPNRSKKFSGNRKPAGAKSKQKATDSRDNFDRVSSKKRTDNRSRDVGDLIKAKITHPDAVQNVTFADLGVGDNLVRKLAEMGADTPFPIQAVTIPDAIAGKNVLGRAKTGSGKTIAFGLSVIERLMGLRLSVKQRASGSKAVRKPSALILAPTRELSLQLDRTVQPLARSVGLFTTQIVGGHSISAQVHSLRRGVDIVIGTPGRIEDLLRRGQLDLSQVRITVVDEADHMAELGFIEPVQRILRHVRNDSQTLLFSATLDEDVRTLVTEFMPEHVAHEIAQDKASEAKTNHAFLVIMREDKLQILADLVHGEKKVLVFTRTRAYAETLSEYFSAHGVRAVALHGDLHQQKRTRNLEQFTNGKANVLVATDVAARGIHVDSVDMVVQADPPEDYKAYLHRAGRTGRAGSRGIAITLVPRTRQKFSQQLIHDAQIEPVFYGECSVAQTPELLKRIKKKQ